MANNLKSMINVIANDEAIKNLEERIDVAGGYSDIAKFARAFYENVEVTENDGVLNSWSLDNLGSKWTYMYDHWSGGEFSIESAWYPPKEFFIHLYKLMSAIDPDTIIEVKYEDETYNPTGAFLIKKDSEGEPMWAQNEEDEMENPTDDMDWDDEGYEDAQQEFMEEVADTQDRMLALCHEHIDGNDGEPIE